MKRMKKLTSLFLAALMVIAMAMPVFATQADSNTTQAEKGDFTITINDATEGYVYGAYQIFTADLDNSDEVLSNIQWGSAIDPSKVADVFGADTTAASVAQALAAASKNEAGNLVDDNAAAQEYAAKFAQCLYTTEKTEVVDGVEKTVTVIDNTKATKSGAQENNVYKISGLTAGYYLVLNESIPANGAATRYILEVVKDQIVTPKRDVLIKDKDIVKLAPEGAVKVDEAPIGKVENFRVWAKLPSN